MKQASAICLAAIMAFPAWAGGDSSDGHSHAAPEAVPVVTVGPRAVATTEEFEVVASLEGKQLVVYVDRFASNEPVIQAKVEIEGAGIKGFASETTPGTYVLSVATALPPAKHPLLISIEAGDTADLLSATLDVSTPQADVPHPHGWSERVVWMLSGSLLLMTGILFAARRHKRTKKGI